MNFEEKINRVRRELAAQGRPADYYAACRELGRRGGRARAQKRRVAVYLKTATGLACLPPKDRE